MNTLIQLSMALVFIISAVIGWLFKRFRWLFLPLILSLPISFGVWALVVHTSEMARVGLGIIALAPVFLILIAGLNLVVALVGGIVGIFVSKKWR